MVDPARFARIPNFTLDSMFIAERDTLEPGEKSPWLIMIEREPTTRESLQSLFDTIFDLDKMDRDCYYWLPEVGLNIEGRSGVYNLFYWPRSTMLYAVDLMELNYVFGCYIAACSWKT
jgi:hypothetical protein